MLKNLSRTRAFATWVVALAILTTASVMSGATATPSTWILLFLMAMAPPAVFVLVWRGAPQPTVAELLYTVRQQDGK